MTGEPLRRVTRWARPAGGAGRGRGLRRRRALVGRRRRVPAGRFLTVPAAHRGDGRAAPVDDRRAPSASSAARRTCARPSAPRSSAAGDGSPWSAAPGTPRRSPARCRRRRRRPDAARHAQAQGDADLGALDPRAAGQQHRLRRRHRLARLVRAPVDRAGPAGRALADQGRPGPARQDLMISSAHVIEAVRLAETLASLRGRPLAGLAEVTGGDPGRALRRRRPGRPVRHRPSRGRGGPRLGRPDVPTVPLEADLVATCRRLRIRREAVPRILDLDLRRRIDQERSRLFHRLRLLGIDWIRRPRAGCRARARSARPGRPAGGRSSPWRSSKRRSGARPSSPRPPNGWPGSPAGQPARAHRTVERCLLAELPDALERLLGRSPTGPRSTPTSCT